MIHKYRKIYGAMLVAVGACTLLVTLHLQTQGSQDTIAEQVAPYSDLTSVQFLGTDSASSYRLQRFWLQTLYDPILAMPGTNIQDLKEAVYALRLSTKLYLHFYTPEEQEKIQSNLHPLVFLEQLPDLEAARRAFITDPSPSKAFAYTRLLSQALEALATYTEKTSYEFQEIQRKGYSASFLAGEVSDQYIAQKLLHIRDQAETKSKTVAQRRLCLLGRIPHESCPITHPASYVPTQEITQTSASYAHELHEALKEYVKTSPDVYSVDTTAIEELPLVYIPESLCTHYPDATYASFWRISRQSNGVGIWTTPIDDFLFSNVRARASAFESALDQAGVTYSFQPMNPYFCVDNGLDTSAILSSIYLQKVSRAEPLFATHNNSELLAHLNDKEEVLASTSILKTSDVSSYISTLQQLLYTSEHRSSSDLSFKQKIQALEQIALWRAKSAYFERQLYRLDDMTTTNKAVNQTTHIDLPALFLTRSYFSTLLLLANTTLYDSEISLLEKRNPVDLQNLHLVSYYNDLQQLIPLDELAEFMRQQDVYIREVIDLE